MIYGAHYEDAGYSAAVRICENCRQSAERLTLVPEFDYMGCDDCMEEALAEIARESCCHEHIEIEEHDDDQCRKTFEVITCRDCGEDLVERKGELVARIARKRRAA